MSTQPQLSPIEQLVQGSQPTSAPAQPNTQSNLSPIEQLVQGSQKTSQQSEPDNATIAVPDAGRIPGVMSFGNKVTPGQAASGVAAGAVAGAVPLGIAETLPSVIPSTIEGVKAVGAWAEAHPFHAWALMNVLKEIVPGVKKAAGLVKSAPGE
jgi:hypothetical protein